MTDQDRVTGEGSIRSFIVRASGPIAQDGRLPLASGIAEVQPDGSTIRLLHIEDISVIREARAKPLSTLAREQGIGPVQQIQDLQGDPIDDFEEFLAAVESARHDS